MEVIKIESHIMQQNIYLYFDEDTKEGIVLDPGSMGDKVIDIISKNNIKVKAILLTHGHFDHIGAAREIKEKTGAFIYSHSQEKGLTESPELNLSKTMKRKEISLSVDKVFEHGDLFKVAKTSLEVIHTPGHTPGGVCYYDRKNGLIFTGDTLFKGSVGRSDFPGGSYDDLMSNIKNRLFTLPDSIKVYPGHGEDTTILQEINYNPFFR